MSRLKIIGIIVLALFFVTPIADAKLSVKIPYVKPQKTNVTVGSLPQYRYGLNIQVNCNIKDDEIQNTSNLSRKETKFLPELEFEASAKQFISQGIINFANSCGMEEKTGWDSNYNLRVTVTDWSLIIKEYSVKKAQITASSSAEMALNWELLDPNRNVVISSTSSVGESSGANEQYLTPLFEVYTQAISGIDWNGIASYLVNEQAENNEVKGSGSSALERTVIRWYIQSAPQGADVSWRVVSSSPDVSNTNSNFVGTTPYESTESFDIKGLTYDNSGNVQVEVTCEKLGYLPQRKRFNLRQAIDQKEISAKFNLIKDE